MAKLVTYYFCGIGRVGGKASQDYGLAVGPTSVFAHSFHAHMPHVLALSYTIP